MLDVLGLAQKDKNAIAECYQALQNKYNCVIDNELKEAFTNRISESKLLREYHSVNIKNVFRIRESDREFYILSIYLTDIDLKVDYKVLMFGLIALKKPYEQILIQPFTTWDRLMKLFGGGKSNIIEFKGAKNKYRIAFQSKNTVSQYLTEVFVNELSVTEKIHTEFCDNTFLATFNKPANVEDTIRLADFLSRAVIPLA